jgi:S-methylmethionine-dependent homocysteine/selenocysteine methylase
VISRRLGGDEIDAEVLSRSGAITGILPDNSAAGELIDSAACRVASEMQRPDRARSDICSSVTVENLSGEQTMPELNLPDRVILLDGSMGRELRLRGVEIPETIWSANALLTAPQEVVNVHLDNITAGADVITTNTYGVIHSDLAKVGLEDRFEELNEQACALAIEARQRSGREEVLIAGAMPPLRGSYRADRVGEYEEILPLYQEQAAILARHVDLILCETMSSALEAKAAATAACATGRPVWVAWTLHDKTLGALRSEETIEEAFAAIADLPVCGHLANCCLPESIESVMSTLAQMPGAYCGGYANTFMPIPQEWTLGGEGESGGLLAVRDDLNAEVYANLAARWLPLGANVLGGCCGTSPEYIAHLKTVVAGQS